MDTFKFHGQVYPTGFCVAGRFGRQFTMKEIGRTISVSASIDEASQVLLECTVDHFEDKHFVAYKNKAEVFLNAIVHASAFAKGITLTYMLHGLTLPNGQRVTPMSYDPALAASCTAYSIDDPTNPRLQEVLGMLARFPRIALALDEIAGSKSHTHRITVDCARAIEGLRVEVAPKETNSDRQWAAFRKALNLDRSFIDLVMDHAKEHRHGHRTPKTPEEIHEVVQRSWVIMNRFLEYKLRGDTPLTAPDYPLLT